MNESRDGGDPMFGARLEPLRSRLRLHCYRMLGSSHDADDLVQETFLRAWRARDTLADPSRLEPWLYRIATTTCLDALRKRSPRALTTELFAAADPRPPYGAAVDEGLFVEDAATHRLLSLIRAYDESGAWAGAGLRSCAHWLSWKCGLSPGAARERVRVARALGGLPRIDAMLATGELSFSKVRALTRVATADNEAKLATAAKAATAAQLERLCRGIAQVTRDPKAPSSAADRWVFQKRGDGGMVRIEAQLHPDEAALVMNALDALRPWPKRRDVGGDVPAETREPDAAIMTGTHVRVERLSRADALVKLAELGLAPGGAAETVGAMPEPNRTGGDRATLLLHLAQDDLVSMRTATLDDGRRVPAETLRRIACDAGLVPVLTDDDGQPLDVGRKTRSIPPSIRRALIVRDGRCRFPGCDHTRWLDAHHLEHWMHGGETKLHNLVLLCPSHHQLVHEGGFTLTLTADRQTIFRDPRGRILTLDPIPMLVPQQALARLRADNQNAGASITQHTAESGWMGERIDYSYAVGVLARR